jgi:hypothetical protein
MMKNEDLIKANKLHKEIDDLENFISAASKVRKGKLIQTKYLFKTIPYGVIGSVELELDTELKDKILGVVAQQADALKVQLGGL